MMSTIASSNLKSWHAFAFLVLTAVALYCAKWPILLTAAIVGVVRGWIWLTLRFPKTMTIVNVFLTALLRSGAAGADR
jgi:hypothetical protein